MSEDSEVRPAFRAILLDGTAVPLGNGLQVGKPEVAPPEEAVVRFVDEGGIVHELRAADVQWIEIQAL